MTSNDSPRYPPLELRGALMMLANRIDEEMQARGITPKMLADSGLVSERQLGRWLRHESLPRWPADVERFQNVALAVGISRDELQDEMPAPSHLVPVSPQMEEATTNQLILEQLRSNGQFLSEIRDELRRLGVQLDDSQPDSA